MPNRGALNAPPRVKPRVLGLTHHGFRVYRTRFKGLGIQRFTVPISVEGFGLREARQPCSGLASLNLCSRDLAGTPELDSISHIRPHMRQAGGSVHICAMQAKGDPASAAGYNCPFRSCSKTADKHIST